MNIHNRILYNRKDMRIGLSNLMQQCQVGLSIDVEVSNDPAMIRWVTNNIRLAELGKQGLTVRQLPIAKGCTAIKATTIGAFVCHSAHEGAHAQSYRQYDAGNLHCKV